MPDKKINNDELKKKWNEIIAKSMKDNEFRKRLLADTDGILKEHGIYEEGVQFKIVENTKSTRYLILPMSMYYSEEDLRRIGAGAPGYEWTSTNEGTCPCP